MNRRGLLALVHCACKDLALSEDTYRAVLLNIGGNASARELSDLDLGRVVDHFKRLGWKPKARTHHSDKPTVRKIWAMWLDLGKAGALRNPSRPALRAYCKRLTGVEEPEWLDPAQAHKVIENLKSWQARLERGEG